MVVLEFENMQVIEIIQVLQLADLVVGKDDPLQFCKLP